MEQDRADQWRNGAKDTKNQRDVGVLGSEVRKYYEGQELYRSRRTGGYKSRLDRRETESGNNLTGETKLCQSIL